MIRFFRKIRQKVFSHNDFRKYLFYAIGEIILVVIGILIALQVNNWNLDRINKNRVKQYGKALVQDLTNDVEMINVSQFQAIKSYNNIDSLRSYILSVSPSDLSNTDLFVLTHDIMYRPYKWNRSTFQEMKNSEILHYFENDSLKKKLIAYESFSYHLDEDFRQDITNAHKADEIMTEILDLNNPYFDKMLVLESERFNDSNLYLFNTEEYRKSKKLDVIVSADEKDLRKFVNVFIKIQDSYRIRGFLEMEDIKEDAKEIIQLLEAEFN